MLHISVYLYLVYSVFNEMTVFRHAMFMYTAKLYSVYFCISYIYGHLQFFFAP